MSAPWRVELHEYILLVVQHDVREGLALHHLHVAFQVRGSRLLALQMRLELSVEEGGQEGLDALHSVLEKTPSIRVTPIAK